MINHSPRVCICVPVFNAAETITETLESLCAQTYENIEIHVVDNASTDNTVLAVESISDPRIFIHCFKVNVGGEGNFNRCIELSGGSYTAIFHSDDIYEKEMVEKQVAFLEMHPHAGAVFTEATLIDEIGNAFGRISLPYGLNSKTGLYDFSSIFKMILRHGNFFICPSFMVRTKVYKQDIEFWRGDMFGSSSDLDVWLRILQKYSIGHIPERLMRYRVSKKQFSAGVRDETKPGIIFKVIDHYLLQDKVKDMIVESDLVNYLRLERRDRIGRSINLFLMGNYQESKDLLGDIYSRDAILAAFVSKRGMLVLFIGLYIKIMTGIGLGYVGRFPLRHIKNITHR